MALTTALQDLEFLVLADNISAPAQQGSIRLPHTFWGSGSSLSRSLADAELQAPGRDHPLSFRAVVVALPAYPRTLSWKPPTVCEPGGDSNAQGQHGQEGQRGLDFLGSSIPESRQQHYDWLGHWELAEQTIMSGISYTFELRLLKKR